MDMQNMTPLERARLVAAKLSCQLPDGAATKRPADSSSDDNSAKKFASINDAVGANLAMLKAQQLGGGVITEDYKVPDKQVGLIIGRGGEQLHKIVAETQCKLQIAPDSGGSSERNVTLIGTKEAIENGKKAIEEVLKRAPGYGGGGGGGYQNGGGYNNSNVEVFEMRLPGNKCGLVIGKGGETIKRLSEQYAVKLVVVQETNAVHGADKPLRITGDPEKVAKAREAVMELIQPKEDGRHSNNEYGSRDGGGGRYRDQRGGAEALIKVPGDKAGIVIGKGGESIKDIKMRSGAHVEIDKSTNSSDTNDKMFIIRGTAEQIEIAQKLIYEKITGNRESNGYNNYNNNHHNSGYGGNNGSTRSGSAGGGHSGGGYNQGAYGAQNQWQNPYGQQAAVGGAADPNMANAWQTYYQNYYQQIGQPGVPGAATTAAAGAGGAAAAGTTAATATPTTNPQTGQPDYSQAWVEYYRSLGMYEQADAILKQTQAGAAAGGAASATSSTSSAQSGSNGGATGSAPASTNGNNTAPSSGGASTNGSNGSSGQNGQSQSAAGYSASSGSWPGAGNYAGYQNYSGYAAAPNGNGQSGNGA